MKESRPHAAPVFDQAFHWFWALPYLSVAFLILAMVVFMLLAQRLDFGERRSKLIEDILWQEQTIRHELRRNEDVLGVMALDLAQGSLTERDFVTRASFLQKNSPDMAAVMWVDQDRRVRWGYPTGPYQEIVGGRLSRGTEDQAFERARASGRPVYGAVHQVATGDVRFDLYVPVFAAGRFGGTIIATYSLPRILDYQVPWWYAQRYQLQVIDGSGGVLAAKLGIAKLDPELAYDVFFDPPGYGLTLRATAYRAETPFFRQWLVVLVLALSALMIWSLWALRNHMRERVRAEQALSAEWAFRKAMEDSIVIGMRAVDMEGRISYVNRAFCRMVGRPEEELVGCGPPMPYWAPEDVPQILDSFQAMLQGTAPAGGVEHRFCRPDGTRLDVLIYASPLIDENGRQTGWMASVNDITERKRAREELRRSHERFMAVLNALDAAVSVTDVESGELLYANGYFRKMFGLQATEGLFCYVAPWRRAVVLEPAREGTGQEETSLDLELQNPRDGRWYHIRCRAFTWVDGRPVRMEMATDITARAEAEEQERQRVEKLHSTARLVTMGEMASTLAHELNQPLSAIASYSTGCLNLLKANRYSREELIEALDKVGAQAQRAGKIIRSIREFVKRSEPRCESLAVNEIVDEAAGFAEIEARKRGVTVRLELTPELPPVMADRIMIQQVVHNLVRNGIEAVTSMPNERRRLTVRTLPGNGSGVEIQVADQGPGIPPGLAERLFLPFFTTKAEGMGMGLNICRSIVEFHKGRLWFEPNPAGGTVFRFILPSGD